MFQSKEDHHQDRANAKILGRLKQIGYKIKKPQKILKGKKERRLKA